MASNVVHTNWYVITGGPSSGKTTTVNLLQKRGYKTTIEHARHYIETQQILGKSVEEIRKNQAEFQLGVLNMQIAQEAELAPDETVFLDRAIPDARAYCRFLDLPEAPELKKAMNRVNYKKVFLLDPLPLVNDDVRTEDSDAQKKIHALIAETYGALPFPLVHIPAMSSEERVDLILSQI